jgi:putative transposase
MANADKNAKIADSLRLTREKRVGQTCRVFKIKIDISALSQKQITALQMQFVEAKWLVNEALASPDIWKYVPGKTVVHKDRDMNDITSTYQYLGSQQKQSLVEELKSNIKTLVSLKRKNKRIGKIRFKRSVTSINLKQYGTTYKLKSRNHIAIQNIPGKIRVHGLDQIISSKGRIKYDLANAKLLNTAQGYFLAITCYKDNNKIHKPKTQGEIGLDFGISTAITLSNGIKLDAYVQESDRLRRLQRRLSRQKPGSKRRSKTQHMIKIEYQKMNNKKNDLANKIVAQIKRYAHIYMQDENITSWKKWFGKKVQHSVLGRVKARLIPDAHVLDRWEPTTKLCVECGTLNVLKLSDRRYRCACGVDQDRDVHAAQNMIDIYHLKTSRYGTCRIDARGEVGKTNQLDQSSEIGTPQRNEKPSKIGRKIIDPSSHLFEAAKSSASR